MKDSNEERIKQIEKLPRRAGRKELIKYHQGEKLTRDEAIKAKCYECVNGEDFRTCNVSTCPLTLFSPLNKL